MSVNGQAIRLTKWLPPDFPNPFISFVRFSEVTSFFPINFLLDDDKFALGKLARGFRSLIFLDCGQHASIAFSSNCDSSVQINCWAKPKEKALVR
jgi:hypothetical protein